MSKASKFKASIPRYMYWKSDFNNNRRCCPKCGSGLEKEYHSYMVVSEIDGERESFLTGNDNGYFCKKCPVVVLDKKGFEYPFSAATGKKEFKIAVTGIVDFDAVPEDKKHIPLGEDNNPIPLVEFMDHKADEENNKNKKEIDEKHLLEKAVSYEFNNNLEEAEKCINEILSTTPTSYHALFLKARITRKKGNPDIEILKSAFREAVNQNAGKGVFVVILDEMKDSGIFEDYLLSRSWLGLMKKQEDRILEKALGFNHYVEMKDRLFVKNQSHDSTVKAFFDFVNNQKLKVVKTYDGKIEEFFDMDLEKIKKNLLLLEQRKGDFYDDDLCVSYSFLGNNFFAYVHPGMIFFSAEESNVRKMAEILNKYGLKYHEPYELGER
ncbi:hypothetical protein KY366_07585 [Candidatus Woesearchaeota archaeon]|nr:hypothetical protein [Candidatus Woesearchaeota archaeon]